MNRIKDYPCPECGAEMERGFVTTNHSLRWSQKESTGRFFAIAAEPLSPIGWVTNPKCPGLRCRKCRVVVLKETR